MNLDSSGFPPPDNHVVQFRPRRKKSQPDRPDKSTFRDADGPSPVRDFARYQRALGRDDYRHRMRMNAIVFAFTTTLVVAGVWLVTMIAHPHS
jgi:hypothetical protein